VEVSKRGAARLFSGHPWIYRSDVIRGPQKAGLVAITHRGRFLAHGLYNPNSELTLRAFSRKAGEAKARLLENLEAAIQRREPLKAHRDSGVRLVHAEGDQLPGLVVDLYGDYVVMQVNALALEALIPDLVQALNERLSPKGILLRNDARGRILEGLPTYVRVAAGSVPEKIWLHEGAVQYASLPYEGQKTGAFLDQRDNRLYAESLAARKKPQRALDVFSYHGLFALHISQHADEVIAVDSSRRALDQAKENARQSGISNIRFLEANAFDLLRSLEKARERFDLIVLDPPSFARKKHDLPKAFRAYKEINLRAMKLLRPGGLLLSASCSHHLSEAHFEAMLREAAADVGRSFQLLAKRSQSWDHPVLLNVPETHYLKFAALEALT